MRILNIKSTFLFRIGIIFFAIVSMLFTGCAHKSKAQSNRYHRKHDSAPHGHEIPAHLAHIKDAVPKHEPKSKYGNPEKYRVLSRTYRVMPCSKGFKD